MHTRFRQITGAFAAGLVAAFGLGAPGKAMPGGMHAGAHKGLSYKLHIPAQPSERPPLVVMLHGCTQDPDQFATSTQMNQIADREGFLVLYPGQNRISNPRGCWNWFMPGHQMRDAGEPAAIASLVDLIARDYRVDRRRIYLAGLSAGGAMATILAANYPDVFAGVGVCSGLAYRSAHDIDSALTAMEKGAATGVALPSQVKAAMAGRGEIVPMLVIHGSNDVRVVPKNADQLASQWAQAGGLSAEPSDVTDEPALPGGRPYQRAVWGDAAGRVLVERWLVRDLSHAWPGGDARGTHVDPMGPSASEGFWTFFSGVKLALSR